MQVRTCCPLASIQASRTCILHAPHCRPWLRSRSEVCGNHRSVAEDSSCDVPSNKVDAAFVNPEQTETQLRLSHTSHSPLSPPLLLMCEFAMLECAGHQVTSNSICNASCMFFDGTRVETLKQECTFNLLRTKVEPSAHGLCRQLEHLTTE